MIQCTERTPDGTVQCARERGHSGPHSISHTIDVPEELTPFLTQAWENLLADQKRLAKTLRTQRLISLALMVLVVFYGGLIVGQILEHLG
jgi:hypothetical protein